jgi:predicted secreted protein
MNWVEGIVVYVLVWWVVIFAILPFWVRQQDEVPPGHAPGAPTHPHLWRKAAVTTLVSAIIWLGIYALASSDLITFRGS